jgi:hypothetical protein|tara:strand:+ start:92735 stop:93088 length:354 start_codon:yes stop_codon:yes gene_type:complete
MAKVAGEVHAVVGYAREDNGISPLCVAAWVSPEVAKCIPTKNLESLQAQYGDSLEITHDQKSGALCIRQNVNTPLVKSRRQAAHNLKIAIQKKLKVRTMVQPFRNTKALHQAIGQIA